MPYPLMRTICLLLFVLVVAGCSPGGKGKPRAPVFKVKGKITFLGSPVVGGIVSFSPDGDQPAAVGRTDDAGEFTLTTYAGGDGAAAGNFHVCVMLPDAGEAAPTTSTMAHSADGKNMPDTHAATRGAKRSTTVLPAKYSDPKQTPLTATVDPKKDNVFPPFELK